MPWARPASAGLSLSVSDTNGSTAANAYQSAARKISHRMASASIHFCQLAILRRSVSAMLVQVMIDPRFGKCLREGKFVSGRRRQEIDFVFGSDANHLCRVRKVVDAFEQFL